MKIELKKITVEELAKGYQDNTNMEKGGIVGYGGKLDIRPQYQRNFIYNDKQRNAVIDTVKSNFPLNVMYWAVKKDGSFEVIDGQQRTISICQYVTKEFAYKDLFFQNLQDDQQKKVLDYELMIYICSGDNSEKIKWFETINIAGEKLSDQELRNAIYSGPWVSDAKRYFSKSRSPAHKIAKGYLNGSYDRQDYLETAIKWISKDNINTYMAKNQYTQNANILWNYFQAVVAWVDATFQIEDKPFMKGVEWGELYNEYKDKQVDTNKIKKQVAKLLLDDDVSKKSGIYEYILTGKEKHLSIRAFTESMRRKVYQLQKRKCKKCKKKFELKQMHADHIKPWHAGGRTNEANCQLLCREDNLEKSGK